MLRTPAMHMYDLLAVSAGQGLGRRQHYCHVVFLRSKPVRSAHIQGEATGFLLSRRGCQSLGTRFKTTTLGSEGEDRWYDF